VINGAHVIVYSTDAEADRDFIQETLGFAGVDAGQGWMIFRLPPAEIAVHPTSGPPVHELYLMCDDIKKTLDDLASKGVQLAGEVSDEGWGLLASIKLPSGGTLPLYEPRHPVAREL
jgi:hypothetical protein